MRTQISERGAMMAIARAPRPATPVDVNVTPVIYNPHALPMYKEDFMKFKRKRPDGPVRTTFWRPGRVRPKCL